MGGANNDGHADTEVFHLASKEWIKLESIGFVNRVINAPIVWSKDAFYIIGGRTHFGQADLAGKLVYSKMTNFEILKFLSFRYFRTMRFK